MRGYLAGVELAACAATTVAPDAAGREEVVFGVPVAAIDVLFVVDGTPAMAAHQAHVRASAAGWLAAFADLHRGSPNLHIGVISSDLGALGGPDLGVRMRAGRRWRESRSRACIAGENRGRCT